MLEYYKEKARDTRLKHLPYLSSRIVHPLNRFMQINPQQRAVLVQSLMT